MNSSSQKLKIKVDYRLLLVCAVSASVGLSMAVVSLAKFALFTIGLAFLLSHYLVGQKSAKPNHAAAPAHTARAILVILAVFSLSLFWTTAETSESVGSITKYGKLLTILLLPLLLKDRQETLLAITVFVLAQVFLVGSSWLLYFDVPIPWATTKRPIGEFSVFSAYLDQSVMSAVTAAICWHLRDLVPWRYGRHVCVAIAALCVTNVLFVLIGRSGHVTVIVLLSLAVMWELPKRFRWLMLILPLLLLVIFYMVSPKVQTRILMVKTEVQAFSFADGVNSLTGNSSGIRLHFWNRAVQSITESPLLGSGVGSWSNEYNRLEKQFNPKGEMLGEKSNPHQEYLLWGVQLGVPGILLFMGFLVSLLRDTFDAETATARAAQSVLAALAVSCLFNSSIYDALIGDFFCVALGLMLALASKKSGEPLVDP